MDFCAVLDEQEIFPGFAALKVGKALLILGKVGKQVAYSDRNFEFKQKEVKEALDLVSGSQGAENMHCFALVVTQTSRRLATFVRDFAQTLKRKVEKD